MREGIVWDFLAIFGKNIVKELMAVGVPFRHNIVTLFRKFEPRILDNFDDS